MKIYRLSYITAIVDSPGVWRRSPVKEVLYKDINDAISEAKSLLDIGHARNIPYEDTRNECKKVKPIYKYSVAHPYCAWISFLQSGVPVNVTITSLEVL